MGGSRNDDLWESPSASRRLPIAPYSTSQTHYGEDLRAALNRTIGCLACPLAANRTHVVPGAGDPDAIVAFVGEAPGRDEDAQGLPFVGAAGELLDKMIEGMQGELRRFLATSIDYEQRLKTDAVFSRQSGAFVLNVCQCRPPLNRKPERLEVSVCSLNLWAILRALPRVRIVVALGATPLQAVSGQHDAKITRLRGQWFERCLPGDEARVLRVMPTFHPAYLLRSPWEKPKAWADLLEVVAEMRGAS